MTMRINPYLYGALAVALFLGVIYGAQAAGLWHTSDRVTATGETVTVDPTDVTTVKGWMTLADVEKAFKIPLHEILDAFDLTADTPSTMTLKDAMKSRGYEVDDLRDWLAKRD
jgi:hypothetical protein